MFKHLKRILSLLCILFLIGCKTEEAITMMVPFGNPQLSQLYVQENSLYRVDIVMGAEPLVAAFGSASHDVIFAPSNLGAKFFTVKDDYTLLGVVTWSNYYFISERELSLESIKNQKVYVFGQNQVSDILVKIINEHFELHLSVEYLDSLPTASAYALINPNDIILVSNPSATQLKKNNPLFNLFDLGVLYETLSEGNRLPQASVFVHKRLSNHQKLAIQQDIIESINQSITHASETIQVANQLGITWDDDVIQEAFLSQHITYVCAQAAKHDLETFFNYILMYQPMMISQVLPADAFYEGG